MCKILLKMQKEKIRKGEKPRVINSSAVILSETDNNCQQERVDPKEKKKRLNQKKKLQRQKKKIQRQIEDGEDKVVIGTILEQTASLFAEDVEPSDDLLSQMIGVVSKFVDQQENLDYFLNHPDRKRVFKALRMKLAELWESLDPISDTLPLETVNSATPDRQQLGLVHKEAFPEQKPPRSCSTDSDPETEEEVSLFKQRVKANSAEVKSRKPCKFKARISDGWLSRMRREILKPSSAPLKPG